MNLLAIETSTECCSAALVSGDRIIARSELAPRRHAALLLRMCEELLAEAGLSRRALDGIATGCGPGAFTGVRLAISAAQGMALALDVPVVPVSSLAALALQAPDNGAAILAVLDARMGEVYSGSFARVDGELVATAVERVGQATVLELPDADAWNVIGSGWATYADELGRRLPGAPAWAAGDRFPQAREVARLALPRLAAGGGLDPAQALPVYLRDKVALTIDEQRAARMP